MKVEYGNGAVTTDAKIKAFKITYVGKVEITPADNLHVVSNDRAIVGVNLSGEATMELFEYTGDFTIKRCEVVQEGQEEKLTYPVISYQGPKLPENINSDPQYIDQNPEDMVGPVTASKTGRKY